MFAALQKPKSVSCVGSETEPISYSNRKLARFQEGLIYHLLVFMSIICFCAGV